MSELDIPDVGRITIMKDPQMAGNADARDALERLGG